MSNDSVTVRSSRSWFGRIGGALTGVLFGIVLFIGSFVLLAWNEGRAIKRAKTLEFGSKEVISIPPSPIDPAHAGKLVHVTGDAVTQGELSDPVFGITAPALKLRRNVEMYQWTEEKKSETQKKLGGGEETVTTYTYAKKWSASPIDSEEFQKPQGHTNPQKWPVSGKTLVADRITVGDFVLPANLVGRIDNYEPLSIPENTQVSSQITQPVQIEEDGFYLGKNPEEPAIGDLRVGFESASPGPVSIVARQVSQTFEAYPVKSLGTIELLETGTSSADAMFTAEMQSNVILTWILRIGGFFLMYLGLVLIGNPISVLADIVPLFGNIASFGIGLLAFATALPLSLGTIALAWLAYRPLIGIPLLIVTVASAIWGIRLLLKKKRKTSAAPVAA